MSSEAHRYGVTAILLTIGLILAGSAAGQTSIQIEEVAKGSGRYYVYSPSGELLDQHDTYRKARDTADACALDPANAGQNCYIMNPYLSTVTATGMDPAPEIQTDTLGFGMCAWMPLSDEPVQDVVYKVGPDDGPIQWEVPVTQIASIPPTDFIPGPYFFRMVRPATTIQGSVN